MKRPAHTALLALAVLWTNSAGGQPTAPLDPDVARIRTEFAHGNYAEVLRRANEGAFDRGNLSETDLVELHKDAGLAAFYLNQKAEAERHLWAVLQLDPDYSLDPFVVPPKAISFFEGLRREYEVRGERRRRADRLKEAEERERSRVDAEQQRRRLEELARQASASRVRSESFAVNLLPFGAGQFQQGRTGAGIAFAATEGAFALTSIIAFFAYNALIEERGITLDERLTPDQTYGLTVRGILPDKHHQAIVWRNVKYGSAGAFWLTYAIGVVDALLHHRPRTASPSPIGEAELQRPDELPEDEKRSEPSRVELSSPSAGMGAGIGLVF